MRFRSIFPLFFAAIIILGGCGGSTRSVITPQSSNFVYFANGSPFSASGATTLVYKLDSDGTLTASSSFSDPDVIFGQSGNFLIGTKINSPDFGTTTYSINTQTGVAQSRIGHIKDDGGVTDGTMLYVSNAFGGGLDAYSISSTGQFALLPGAPFDAASGNIYQKLQLSGQWLFGAFATPGNTGNITVFSRAASGALVRKFDFGNGHSPFNYAVHPSTRFAYVVSDVSNLDVYSLDVSAGSATLIQQVSDPSGGGYLTLDPSGRYLFLYDKGFREFSIDQNSGKLTEIAGPPFTSPNSALNFDPAGHFLLVTNKNLVTVYALNASNGSLTQIGPVYTIGDDLVFTAFATF